MRTDRQDYTRHGRKADRQTQEWQSYSRQTDRQMDRQAERQTERLTYRQAGMQQADRQTGRQSIIEASYTWRYRQTDIHTYRYRQTGNAHKCS
jgi:hypothetical protein